MCWLGNRLWWDSAAQEIFMSPSEVETTRKTTTWGNLDFFPGKNRKEIKWARSSSPGRSIFRRQSTEWKKNQSVYWGHLGYQFPWDSGSKQQEYSKLSRHYSLGGQHLLNMSEALGKPSAPQTCMHTEYPRLLSIDSFRNRAYADL